MSDPRDLPGVKQSQIEKCVNCGEGVMHDRSLTFYILDVRYMIVDPGAIQRQHGLEMTMGGDAMAGIAAIMGPDEDLAKELHKNSAWLCMTCAMQTPIASLSETMTQRAEGDRDGT